MVDKNTNIRRYACKIYFSARVRVNKCVCLVWIIIFKFLISRCTYFSFRCCRCWWWWWWWSLVTIWLKAGYKIDSTLFDWDFVCYVIFALLIFFCTRWWQNVTLTNVWSKEERKMRHVDYDTESLFIKCNVCFYW